MNRWEFLIQQEGSRLWIPINSPTWELEAGKYRIVAHSSQPNYDVEVRLTYQSSDFDKYPDQVQTCFRRTNSQGLMMVLPFSYLSPGIWELRCYGNIMSELLGQGWQKQIQLRVYSDIRQEQPIIIEPEENNNTKVYPASEKAAYYLQQLEQLLKLEIEPMLQTTETSIVVDSQENREESLQLTLNQDTFIRSQGESILIAGRVEEINAITPLIFNGKLRYKLRDPNTEKTLLELEESITEETLPFIFNHDLDIPYDGESTFLIGEVILERKDKTIISSQLFTVTTDLKPLSHSINYTITLSTPEDSFAFDILLDEETATTPLNVDLPEPTQTLRNYKYAQTSAGQVLPPKIAKASNSKPKSLQLPRINKPEANSTPENETPKKVNVEQAFESLQLEKQFLSRLNSLAVIEDVSSS